MAHYEAFPPSRERNQRNHYASRYHYGSANNTHYESHTNNRPSTYLSAGLEPHLRQSRSSYNLRPAQLHEPIYRTSTRILWPPRPYVEDEWVALAKEHNPQFIADGEVHSRGTIDQEPVLIDLVNLERRFVLLSHVEPTTKSENRNNALKTEARSKTNGASVNLEAPLKLNVETEQILERRKPTPYSYTKPETGGKTPRGQLFSPESTLPMQSTSVPRSIPSSRKTSKIVKKPKSDSSEESDVDPRENTKRRTAHRTSSTKSSAAESLHLPVRNARSAVNTPAEPPSIRRETSRSSMAGSLPKKSPIDERSDTPRASVLNPPAPSIPRRDTRSDSYYSSSPRKETPRHISLSGGESLSPRVSQPSSFDSSRGRSSPRPDSRPTTPSSPYEPFPFESPVDKYDRHSNGSFPFNNKPNQPSKLSSSIRHSKRDEDVMPGRFSATNKNVTYPDDQQRRGGNTLPYPDTNAFIAMPSEHTFLRSDSLGPPPPAIPMERTSSMASNSSTSSNSRRHASTTESRSSRTSSSRSNFDPVPDSAPRSIPPPPPLKLPACPRKELSTNYDDWWTLENYPSLDICPTCLEGIIRPSPFRRLFVPAKRRSPNLAIQCDFGSPWTRLAWLLTIQQQREDLSLITGLARIWEVEPACPGTELSQGAWWGLVDANLYFVSNFYICARDKANIEFLFPALTGGFTKVPSSASYSPHLCSMRPDTRRFAKYLDLISKINERAVERYIHESATSPIWDLRPRKLTGSADTRPFIDFAKSLGQVAECPKDQIDNNASWHYISDFPDLTVCPECFDAIIRPDLYQAPGLASLFTRTPQPLGVPSIITESPSARLANTDGLTCQLYSPRMQTVWNRAVEDDNVSYLIRKMQERRSKEVQLRREKAELVRLLNRGSVDVHMGGGVSRELLLRDLAKVAREWEEYV